MDALKTTLLMLFLLEIVGGVKKKSVGYVHITHTFNNRKLAKLWYNDSINFSSRSDNFIDICPPGKNPLQMFYEYAQSQHLTCDVIETSSRIGPPHDLTFYMAARLGEHQFDIVTGKSLNETKNRATAEALRQLKKQGLYTQTQGSHEDIVEIQKLGSFR